MKRSANLKIHFFLNSGCTRNDSILCKLKKNLEKLYHTLLQIRLLLKDAIALVENKSHIFVVSRCGPDLILTNSFSHLELQATRLQARIRDITLSIDC